MIPPNSSYAEEGATELPEQLSLFVQRHSGVEGAVVFTSDSLLRSFSSTLSLARAEQVSAVAGQLFTLAGRFATLARRGEAEQVVVRVESAFLLVVRVTSAAGLALLTSRATALAQIAGEAHHLVERLQDFLPQVPSYQVGAPLLTGAAV